MQIYHYDRDTGAYLGPSLADESPLEPGVFILPAHATKIEPPETDSGDTAVWNGAAWEQVEDHRGETVYDTATLQELQVMELGPLSDDVTTLQPATVRDEWDGAQWVTPPPEPVLLSAFEFKERFTPTEQAAIMTSRELAPLALHVLTAPRGVDVTDAKAQEARAALEAAGWSVERLNEIFAVPGG
ncbi:hypothetical protein [Oceanidesulfovibrio marinus]|uniref:Phage tail protein n=1 Tax=Oceanidesulfovibrio marinus TaxID=370038 RepID=A0ABX6NKR3_9BACT|nr:hypothetical protein [Oceanidesulfovibrio marinus]QJT10220.1 hypothetical protein E8L03_15350 [Oceanidesulfovibrio marinus]